MPAKYRKTGLCQTWLLVDPVDPRVNFQNPTGLIKTPNRGILMAMQDMKLLFSSRNRAQIERAYAALLAAGIRCEIRDFPVDEQESGTASYAELWVEGNPDYHTAAILYASPLRVLQQQAASRAERVPVPAGR